MKTISTLALLSVLGFAACHSDPITGHRYRYSDRPVDDDVLGNVRESERNDNAKARTDWNEHQDRVAIAQRNVEQEKARLKVAKAELDAAEASLRAARKGVDVAYESDESVREREIDDADDRLEEARRQWLSRKSKFAYHEAHIDQLESDV